jgi:hypothetical protein
LISRRFCGCRSARCRPRDTFTPLC